MSQEKIAQIQKSLLALKGKLGGNLDIEIQKNNLLQDQEKIILDQDIMDLQKNMKKNNFSVGDLFSQDDAND